MNQPRKERLNRNQQAWRDELQDLIRGASGGFLFGIPLIYTMEVWWIGSYAQPPIMLAVLTATFCIVFLLNQTDGFRQYRSQRSVAVEERESVLYEEIQPIQKTVKITYVTALTDSVETIAIGLVCTTCALILLREITLNTSLSEMLGKIVFESVPFSIGVVLAREILRDNDNRIGLDENEETGANRLNPTVADIGATLVGAVIVAFSIAPTDEIPMIAAATSPPWLLAVMVMSILISYGIVFVAGFTTQVKRRQHRGIFQHPWDETIASYLISLAAAALMLWFFQRLELSDPWTLWLRQTILLGLPAAIGGAAGRLAV